MKTPRHKCHRKELRSIVKRNVQPKLRVTPSLSSKTHKHNSERSFIRSSIDLMHDDVTRPERQYGGCSHAQIQD